MEHTSALHLLANKYYELAPCVMLVYDHILTLGQEVERIWMRKISFASVLFLINRYVTLMQLIIIVVSYNDPGWKGKSCTRYVKFQGITTVSLIAIAQMIMILRVVALYNRSKKIFAFLLFLWTGQIIIQAVGLSGSFALPLRPGLVGCMLTGGHSMFPAVWIAPLFTDSFIFLVTIYRTRHNIGELVTLSLRGRAFAADRAMMIVLRDGVIYYFFIFLANLMNVLIFFLAESDLKAIGAAFSELLTCTVVSRLVLNLRSLSGGNQGNGTVEQTMSFNVERPPYQLQGTLTPKQLDTIWTRTLDDFSTSSDSLTLQSGHNACEAGVDIPLRQVELTYHHGNEHPPS